MNWKHNIYIKYKTYNENMKNIRCLMIDRANIKEF